LAPNQGPTIERTRFEKARAIGNRGSQGKKKKRKKSVCKNSQPLKNDGKMGLVVGGGEPAASRLPGER